MLGPQLKKKKNQYNTGNQSGSSQGFQGLKGCAVYNKIAYFISNCAVFIF
jgi:hypothetical protein